MCIRDRILPTTLLLSFAAARQGVPFPAVIEVLLMEIAFELLREAGVRLPGAMGNTIGIVGGLIIGQAAVEANIVKMCIRDRHLPGAIYRSRGLLWEDHRYAEKRCKILCRPFKRKSDV